MLYPGHIFSFTLFILWSWVCLQPVAVIFIADFSILRASLRIVQSFATLNNERLWLCWLCLNSLAAPVSFARLIRSRCSTWAEPTICQVCGCRGAFLSLRCSVTRGQFLCINYIFAHFFFHSVLCPSIFFFFFNFISCVLKEPQSLWVTVLDDLCNYRRNIYVL